LEFERYLFFYKLKHYLCTRISTSSYQTDVKQLTQNHTVRSAWTCDTHLPRKMWFKPHICQGKCDSS